MISWTVEPVAAEGPRKGEPSPFSMRHGLKTQPAHSVRGSSRRIMTMRFRPANIRVINRRVCSCAAIGPAVQYQEAQGSPAGTCSRYAARRCPTSMPERCSPARVRFAAPKSGAPLPAPRRSGRSHCTTGGSGGNTNASLDGSKRKGRFPSCGGKPA